MKKNRTMRVAVLMLALTLLTCCFVGSTFAKYTSTASGTASVTVANWEINVGPDGDTVDITGADSITFALFNTINDTKDHNDEADVKDNMIAPGTEGSFTFKIENASDVNAQYKVDFFVYTMDGGNKVAATFPTNFVFTTKNGGATVTNDPVNSLTDIEFTAINMGGTASVQIDWAWAFETTDGDADDTADGIANKTIYVDATIVVEQVD